MKVYRIGPKEGIAVLIKAQSEQAVLDYTELAIKQIDKGEKVIIEAVEMTEEEYNEITDVFTGFH